MSLTCLQSISFIHLPRCLNIITKITPNLILPISGSWSTQGHHLYKLWKARHQVSRSLDCWFFKYFAGFYNTLWVWRQPWSWNLDHLNQIKFPIPKRLHKNDIDWQSRFDKLFANNVYVHVYGLVTGQTTPWV